MSSIGEADLVYVVITSQFMLVIMTNIAPRPPACPASRPTLSLRAANQRREAAALTNQRRKAAGGGSLTTGSQTGSGSVSVQWTVGE